MSYIQLDDVNETYLLGAWKIKKRVVNSNNMQDVFATSSCIKFNKKSFVCLGLNGSRNKGNWRIIREREVIYNPQVKFELTKTSNTNSIITNLMTDDHIHFKLILYFDSGLELVLEKDGLAKVCR